VESPSKTWDERSKSRTAESSVGSVGNLKIVGTAFLESLFVLPLIDVSSKCKLQICKLFLILKYSEKPVIKLFEKNSFIHFSVKFLSLGHEKKETLGFLPL
jgi:hypothetical protein